MDPGVAVPLMVYGAVVVIVALFAVVRVLDREADSRAWIHRHELEHRDAMEKLDLELQNARMRIGHGGGGGPRWN